MNADPAHRRATYADLEAAPEHLVAEIVDGRLEAHPRGAPRVGAALFALSYEVQRAEERRRNERGIVTLMRPELHIGDDIIVPDLAFWRRERMPVLPETNPIDIAPDWVCDLITPATKRLILGPKRRIYALAGVTRFWIVDPPIKILEAFALVAGQWLLLATFEPGDEVRVAPFDAVGFPMDALFPFDEPVAQKPSEEA